MRGRESRIEDIISDFIRNGGVLTNLAYSHDNRDNCIMVKKMKDKVVRLPNFSKFEDNFNGLGILVHGLAGAEISIDSYVRKGNSFDITVRYELWDNFGLDDDDFSLLPRLAGGNGFDAWYVLQHYNKYKGKYKPFRTVFEFTDTFAGTIN